MLKDIEYVDNDEYGFTWVIDVNEEFAGVQVQTISMYISTEWDGEDFTPDGDLAVNWDMTGLENNEDARTAGTLLLRDMRSNDEVTRVMSEFYWEHGFDARLHEILVEHGFSEYAAKNVLGSEWGMQDEGRASYDAYEVADEVRKAVGVTAEAELSV